jgi:hypothetical protein
VILFSNYAYASGTSDTLRDYFAWFADKTIQENPDAKHVLDIACNDCSQLDAYKNRGLITVGIDPATNILTKHAGKHHKLINAFFSDKVMDLGFQPDIIVCQNVLGHVSDPHSFIRGCKHQMSDKTTLYIQTSQCDMLKNNEFDTIYHEHVSYFSVMSMKMLLNLNGLFLHRVERTNIHGNSFLFTVKKVESIEAQPIHIEIPDIVAYKDNVSKLFVDIKNSIRNHHIDGFKCIGYGASAKGNTMLNHLHINLDYILDDQASKQGMYTPGMYIPIKEPMHLTEEKADKLLIVALTWNFHDEIMRKIRFLTKDFSDDKQVYILRYFPQVSIERLDRNLNLTVIAHFYNERYLLPWWLNYHKNIFDYGVMIDYDSTDNSVEIIRKIVPHWTIIRSRNRHFIPKQVDNEVKDVEDAVKYGYKVALNITEYIQSNIRDTLRTVRDTKMPHHLRMQVVYTVDNNPDYQSYLYSKPLLCQTHHGIVNNDWRSHRFIHNCAHGNYGIGRHTIYGDDFIDIPSIVLYVGMCHLRNTHMNERALEHSIRSSKFPTAQSLYDFNKKYGEVAEVVDMTQHPLTKPFFDLLSRKWLISI